MIIAIQIDDPGDIIGIKEAIASRLEDLGGVRGRWIPFTSEAAGDIWYCSACDIGFAHLMDFCPHCGADMRGGDAE